MKPKKVRQTYSKHGSTWTDDYAWTRNLADPDVVSTLHAENANTEKAMRHLKPLQEDIYREIISRILENDEEHPYPMGDYEYFYRLEKGKNYPMYFRRKKGETNENLLFDLNTFAEGKKFIHLSSFRISPNQKLLALGLDFDGSEHYKILVQEIESGHTIDESLLNTTGSFEWADDQNLYYGRMDATHRSDRVFMHKLGSDNDEDQLLFEDHNLAFHVSFSKSKSDRFLWIYTASKLTSEVSFIDIKKSKTQVAIFQSRKENVKYQVDHQENRFIIQTNEGAENFKFMWASLDHFEKTSWQSLLPYDAERTIEDFDVFENFIVISERYKGLQNFRVLDVDNQAQSISFDEPVYTIGLDHNHVYKTPQLRFSFSSMKTPARIYHFDMDRKKLSIAHEKLIPGYNSANYITEQCFALSRDGSSKIPISLIYKKGFVKNGQAPLFLYGYGSYGMSRNPSFSASVFSLLDRGFAYAIAHVRGGAECGRTWYHDGRGMKKKNTFIDFIDSAKYLIDQKFTSKKKIAICGGSAGGLLMGAVVNMEPELWGAVVALVPFVDIINTMLDETLPLTVTEYDEWGNPNRAEDFQYMSAYSPYDNIVANPFPPVLATGGLSDPRVGFWEPTKWVLKLRENQKANHPILLKMQMEAGHQGPSGRYDAYREVAFYYSFVIDQLRSIAGND